MSASKLGLRYERLLFFSAPLTAICLLVLFVAMASDQQEERKNAKCLRHAVTGINSYKEELVKAFNKERAQIGDNSTKDYLLALRYVLIPIEIRNRCDTFFKISSGESKEWNLTPERLISNLEDKIANLEKKPLSFFGIEAPDKATINIFGTPIKMQLGVLVRFLQIALAPLLLLWLGSLYHTRHRESLFISKAQEVDAIYPHVVNVYPVLVGSKTEGFKSLRKKNWIEYFLDKYAVAAFFALIRVFLLLIFISPPVISFVWSLFYADDIYINMIAGGLVFIFAMINIFSEFSLWHYNRRFKVLV